jgi:protein involved in polysaccharide export with SLBB domain
MVLPPVPHQLNMDIINRMRTFLIVGLAVIFISSAEAEKGPTQDDAPQNNAASPAPATNIPSLPTAPYRLAPGDVIEIRMFYNPELNDQVQIRPDGHVSLQLIGDVELAAKSIPEAVKLLKSKYIEQVRTPELTLQVKTYAAQKVYVVGEVQHPGMLSLPGPMTVFDAISEAGGIKLTGNRKLCVLLRRGPDGMPEGKRLVLFDHQALSSDASIVLGPFDVVMVPESRTSRLDRWVDQTIRQLEPVVVSGGFNYLLSHQTAGGTLIPVLQ